MKAIDCLAAGRVACLWVAICCLSLSLQGHAQDILPDLPTPDKHSQPVYSSEEMNRLLEFVAVDSPMPDSFRQVGENSIIDPDGELNPFWEKLQRREEALRIVHLGDSHVRGHVFPYVMRRCLEDDFGARAVESRPVSYQTSGLAVETGREGVVYHILGVNGATCTSFFTPERLQQVASLQPDLVILSFGTNEAHGRMYSSSEHMKAMDVALSSLQGLCPDAVYLLTTPPGAYVRSGRRSKVVNPRTPQVVDCELKFAREHGLAVWNLYEVAGGKSRACQNWSEAGLFQRDKIHFTHEGYILQGLLFHEAFIKSYNDYVATGLE